jgi:hypothetical protein
MKKSIKNLMGLINQNNANEVRYGFKNWSSHNQVVKY